MDKEPRCTLFISGLPEDIKERELRNLFRFYSGFVGCKLVEKKVQGDEQGEGKGPSFMGFCLFNSEAAAAEVKECLDATKFDYKDPESNSLRISFAKKNLMIKGRQMETPRLNQRGLAAAAQMYYGDQQQYGDPFVNASASYNHNPYGAPAPYPTQLSGTKRKGPITLGDPSTTLYVSNLGETVNEEEIRQLFQTQAGFEEMSVAKSKGRTFAFVLFGSQNDATNALGALQGYALQAMPPSSGGMRISYSKTPFRVSIKKARTETP